MSRHPIGVTGRPRFVIVPTRDDLIDAGFVFVLTALALYGFRSTFSGLTFLLVGLAGTVLGLAIAHLANALRQPWITVAAAGLAVFFLLGGAIALRAEAAGGILPTAGTLRGLADVGVHGWKDLLTTLPPVSGSGPLLAIPYILGLLGGSAGLTMARRLRSSAAPVIGPLLVLATVILLGTVHPAAKLVQGVVFATVALAWIAIRDQRRRPLVNASSGQTARVGMAIAMVVVAGGGAALAGPHLPGLSKDRVVLREHVTPPFDISQFPSPLVGFRKYSKDAPQKLTDQTLFTVSGLPSGTLLRIATLDDYDGSVWAASNGTVATTDTAPDTFQRVGATIDNDAQGPAISYTVTIDAPYAASSDVNAWLPTAGAATSISFDGANSAAHRKDYRYNLATSSAIVPDRLRTGDRVTVRAVATDDSLPSSGAPGRPLALDPSLYGVVNTKATAWSKAATGSLEQAKAIADYLKNHGAFSDGGPGETQYLPGHSVGRLSTFLGLPQTVGDDEQYAAAFALMANSVGLPARVVFGAIVEPDGHTVKGQDVHAWVEVHLADGRWATIKYGDFTPDPNHKPNLSPPSAAEDTNAKVVPPPNPVHPPSSLVDAASNDSLSTHRTALPSAGHAWHLPGFVTTTLKWGGPPLLIIAATGASIVGAKVWRRRRRRTRGSPRTRLVWGWREVVDAARDLGASVPTGRTRREQATLLSAHDLRALALAADARVFGPDEANDDDATRYWASVDDARRKMARSVGRRQRIRAALSLRSLRPMPKDPPRQPGAGPVSA